MLSALQNHLVSDNKDFLWRINLSRTY